jgi:hypothetical protein
MAAKGPTPAETGAAESGRPTVINADADRALIERYHRLAIEQSRGQPLPLPERPTIHWSELPEKPVDSPLYHEWNCYRREVGRLLAEGYEGRWVLIKGEAIVGIWDTAEEAEAVALDRFFLQPSLTQQIRSREPVLRGPTVSRLCRG